MFSTFWRILLADIKSHKGQFVLIGCVLTLCAMLLTILLMIMGSANEPWQKIFAETNGPHVWIVTRQQDLDFSTLLNDPAVTQSTGKILSLAENPLAIQGEKRSMYLYAMDQPPEVAYPLTAQGRWLNPSSSTEAVLDYSLARFLDLEVGDEITIIGAGGEYNLNVVGTAVTGHWFPYNEVTQNISPGVIYISSSALEKIQPDPAYWYVALGLRLKEPENSKVFTEQLQDMYPNQLRSVIEWKWVEQNATFANQLNVLFMGLFSTLGLAAVGLIIFNSIGGQVLTQYREIGLLKAIGLTPVQISLIFLSEHLFIGLIASTIGIAAGILFAPGFISPLAENLNTLPPNPLAAGPIVGVLLLVEGSVTLATLLPAWQGGRINTVDALTMGYKPRSSRISLLGNLGVLLHLPITVIVGIKDTFNRPLRTVMAVTGLTLTILIAVISIHAQITMRDLSENRFYFNGTSADLKLDHNFVPADAIQNEVFSNPNVTAFYQETLLLGQAFQNSDQPVFYRILSGDYEKFEFTLKEGRMISAPGEAVFGYAVLDLIGAQVGDEVDMSIEGQTTHLKIVGRTLEWFNLGHVVLLNQETLEASGLHFDTQTTYLKLKDTGQAEMLREAWLDHFNDLVNVTVIKNEPQSSANQLLGIITGLGIIMLVVGGANLTSTTLLNMHERTRDFGILKTLGLTPNQIAWSVVFGAVLIALISLLIGVPLGVTVMGGFIRQVGIAIGAGPDFYTINWSGLSLLLPVMVLVAGISSALPALRAARIPVVNALRYE